ncbi:g5453 [Coccomyxa viridis]|uniref:G5453 protein n=1 Tax=Coccomyxa viridis TaxID=1274662 RepID=A0ABP1FV47_9CHLO
MEASASMTARPVQMPRSTFRPQPGLPGSTQARRANSAFTSKRPKSSRGRVAATPQALFGTKAPSKQEQYLCIDCGYIYDGRVPFQQLEKDYRCPVCNSPKRRFKAQPRSQNTGSKKSSGRGAPVPQAASGEGIGSEDSSKLVAGGVGILVAAGALYAFLNSQF